MICFLCSLSQVKALKEKIENEKGKEHFPVAGQKLIYAGTSSAFVKVFPADNDLCMMLFGVDDYAEHCSDI